MKKEIMTFTDLDGSLKEAEVILYFEAGEPAKDYAIYTFNETDETGMVALYSSEIKKQDGKIVLCGINTEEEWTMIKDVMKKIVVEWKE